MSLVVSLRIPDGIVVAADSLAVSRTLVELVAQDIKVQCPHCAKQISGKELRFPPFPIPFSASSYTQKLFPLQRNFALSSFGTGVINRQSLYYHVKQFEELNKDTTSLSKTLDSLIAYFEEQLQIEYPDYKKNAPKDWRPLGIHLNGYEDIEGKKVAITYEVYIGRETIMQKRDTIGCTIGGDMKVVQKLWDIGREDSRFAFKYPLFTLQDAIDLSEYLITATSTFQRFANEVPTVGGEIDIALLTPFHDFQWMKRKELMEKLEDGEYEKRNKKGNSRN